MSVKLVNEKEFNELLSGGMPVVCDFFATWCGPCRMLAPALDELAEEMKDRATFVKVDIDQEEALAVKYGIYSVPCVKMFKGGKEVAQNLGFVPKQMLAAFIEQNL